MKKGMVVLLLLLALIVIVSPKIVGHLAEQSLDENVNWAANTSGELVVANGNFDRGWFSSQGQHRIELGQGNLRAALETLVDSGDQEQLPALLINTHIDHGLIPVSSVGRDGGSLAPGLGSAVSTLVFEAGDGTQVELPGKILSTVGLSGNVQSNYVLESGSRATDGGNISWQPTEVQFAVDPKTGESDFEGEVGELTFSENMQSMTIAGIDFDGEQTPTPFGFSVGNLNLDVGEITVQSGGQDTGLKKLKLKSGASIDDGRVNSAATLQLVSKVIPGFGEFSIDADLRSESDAAATRALSVAIKAAQARAADPMEMLESADAQLKQFLAGGVSLDIEQLDVALPMGTIESKIELLVPQSDGSNFEYSALLLSALADIDIQVPESLVDLAVQMNPQAGMIVGLGYLKKNGDVYELNAKMKKGVLTLNGAPTPLPFAMFR